MKSLFQVLVDREIILNNPFKNFKKHKEYGSRKNLAFNEDQISEIKKNIEEKDPELWLFIQFIYYCFLRPNEIRQLEHRYIHPVEKQIFIPSNISKNGKDYTLYFWKHSGVIAAYKAGVDIKTIQSQCRHHSLEQTDIYLKSLGLGVSQAMNKIPEL